MKNKIIGNQIINIIRLLTLHNNDSNDAKIDIN